MSKNLELLIRQNQRKRDFQKYKKQFEDILNVKLLQSDFLQLEETDILTTSFFESFKLSEIKTCEKFSSLDREKLEMYVSQLNSKFSTRNFYLINKHTKICGLVIVPIDKALARYRELIDLDGDSLCLISVDKSQGIYIDYFEENTEGKSGWYYECCTWLI